MHVPEHVGKEWLAAEGLKTPAGAAVPAAADAAQAARELAGPVVIKSQVQVGGRGKAGGIRFAASPREAAEAADALLGSTIAGFPVERVLVEERIDIRMELYAAVLNDSASKGPLVLFSTEGGIDIEDLNEQAPDKILRRPVDIRRGFDRADADALLGDADLPDRSEPKVAEALVALYQVYRKLDAELVEVNPLAIGREGAVWALDCKLSLDPGSRPRQESLFARVAAESTPTGTELERRAQEHGLLFIELDGDVGVLANGAGLTMTTLDAVVHYGGCPANFLEIGGDAYTKATPALELVLSNREVNSLVVNFCGAFARTDVMAEGVVAAIEQLRPEIPISFSIHGTGEEEARRIVRERLGLEPFDLMDDAVKAAVTAAREAREAQR